MNIIFGKENLDNIDSKYTVLELDTICFQDADQEVTAYCLVEQIPILEMSRLEQMRTLHINLLKNYRRRDWNYCKQALEHLVGFWGKELDTFYQTLHDRITVFENTDLSDDWDWRIQK